MIWEGDYNLDESPDDTWSWGFPPKNLEEAETTLIEFLDKINSKNMAEDKKEEKVQYSQWLKRGTSTFIPTDNSKTQKQLDPGVYNIRYTEGVGIWLHKKTLNLDEIVPLPSKEGDEVLDGIKTFWKRKDKFDEYGFTYKRGVLLYGVPGGGKTTIINQLSEHIVKEMNGLVFYISQTNELDLYYRFAGEILREIEPDRGVLVILEDLEGLCSYKENETTLLNILDGVNQINNVVYIATTNYISQISERLKNRPSRFDLRVEVKYPTPEARKIYFEHKLKPSDLEIYPIDKWVNATNEMTMAHLAELIKCVAVLGNDFDESVKKLEALKEVVREMDYNKETKGIGFYGKKAG